MPAQGQPETWVGQGPVPHLPSTIQYLKILCPPEVAGPPLQRKLLVEEEEEEGEEAKEDGDDSYLASKCTYPFPTHCRPLLVVLTETPSPRPTALALLA